MAKVKKVDGAEEQQIAQPQTQPADKRPPFIPRTGTDGAEAAGSSVSFKIDAEGKFLDSTREATLSRFKDALKKSPDFARKLGLGAKGEQPETFTVEHGAKIWRILGLGEMVVATRVGLPFLGRVPKELGHLIPYSETLPEGAPAGMKTELASLAIPTAEVLNFYADALPRWLVDWLKSATGPLANLLEAMLMVHAAKFMLLKTAMQNPEVFKEKVGKSEAKVN